MRGVQMMAFAPRPFPGSALADNLAPALLVPSLEVPDLVQGGSVGDDGLYRRAANYSRFRGAPGLTGAVPPFDKEADAGLGAEIVNMLRHLCDAGAGG
jgi:hypothetical protein